ncbi:hypothetical protein MTR67_045191 [Solanum verrucosum]|uniref:Uncharacterized protein n=1 Tax=Solanum verrucosum TaxID=315347 RepID=A0AAF0UVF3_SOLVR|nr:hypothetical protein MTR67_045191 [Solanum verrucosum]
MVSGGWIVDISSGPSLHLLIHTEWWKVEKNNILNESFGEKFHTKSLMGMIVGQFFKLWINYFWWEVASTWCVPSWSRQHDH